MTPEELNDRKDTRQFIERIVILVLAAIPNFFGMVMQYRTGDRMVQADTARERIESKLDEQHETAKVAVEEAKTAVQKATTVGERIETAVAEIKTMGKGPE